MHVAVLGTGIMGAGMARSLLRAGLPVDVWNRTPERAAALAEDGAVAHADPADAVAHAGVVITILSEAAATRSVALDAGMLAAMPPGAVWAQMGTIGVAATEELAGLVRKTLVKLEQGPVACVRVCHENSVWQVLTQPVGVADRDHLVVYAVHHECRLANASQRREPLAGKSLPLPKGGDLRAGDVWP